jgi:DNA-binding transcriptional LysR family regulator
MLISLGDEKRMLTLRQIEVIRAIMITGTVNGAADLLNVSAPGVSRIMKHTEGLLGMRLFSRQHGRYVPTPEAASIFDQIQEAFRKFENLQVSFDLLKRGASSVFSFASVSSISQNLLPRAVRRLRQKHPDLKMKVDVIKIDEALDYIVLKKGEIAALSWKIDHPSILYQPIGPNSLVAVVPRDHPLASADKLTADEILKYPLIGFDRNDPYGRHMAKFLLASGKDFDLAIQARYAHTVLGLVSQGLGIAVIDAFSVATPNVPGVVCIPVDPPTTFMTYVATNADVPLSTFAESMIELLREEARAIATGGLKGNAGRIRRR